MATLIRSGFPEYCAHFPGGDPRRYEPDPDSATEEEMTRWLAACEAAEERRDLTVIDSAALWQATQSGASIIHLTMFGPGTFYYERDMWGRGRRRLLGLLEFQNSGILEFLNYAPRP